ncbi:MAG: DUF4440 domain-containing protein [Acidobacteriota bacterium]
MSPPSAQDSTSLAVRLRELEQSLLDPAVRRNRARLLALLADDFLEFGSSGRVWTRKTIIDLLAKETAFVPPQIEEFRCAMLAPELALVTYRTVRTDEKSSERLASLRSSIWTCTTGEWRMRFHQGTRTQG